MQRRDVSELTFSRIADGGEEKGLQPGPAEVDCGLWREVS